jgi:hypothetical protein
VGASRAPDDFTVRIGLDAEELWDRLRAHPRVHVGGPPHTGDAGEPAIGGGFVATRRRPDLLELRHVMGPDEVASPTLVVQLEPRPRGCWIHGRVVAPPARRARLRGRAALTATAVLVVTLGIAWAILGGTPAFWAVPLLLALLAIPSAAIMIPGLLIWNAQSRRDHLASLAGLVDEVFSPLALPPDEDEEDPYRD